MNSNLTKIKVDYYRDDPRDDPIVVRKLVLRKLSDVSNTFHALSNVKRWCRQLSTTVS